ncbi:MAG: thioredoxin-dependent thiol peroxidase [Flavobacteriales bacterium]|nr:thioredoxin-dependent thiol peroxidase [Flavobacteriales bacterium]|tara:strand:- start:6231 stop:6692 length:462 start_codon:yes stop_codon:yes gene_type:complete
MTKLKIGDNAPDFCVLNENNDKISLSNFKGKKLILYFYPKDSTPGCTAESCNLRDNYSELLDLGYEVLGVSADNSASHKKFIANNELPFHLLSDTEKEVINAYDVWGPKKFMGKVYEGIHRTTFVIDENGLIERIFTKVNTKEHTAQILETYK